MAKHLIGSVVFWAGLGLAVALAAVRSLAPEAPRRFVIAPAVADSAAAPAAPFYKEELLPMPAGVPMFHSSTITELRGGNLLAAWYGGADELAPDTALYTSTFDRAAGRWSPATVLADRHQTERELHRYLKTIGNPVLYTDAGGRVWLFFVSVSVGGWSGSAVNLKTSDDGGTTWSPARRLVLSPLMNMTAMVRTSALPYDDGTVALPTYHQGVSKFPELVHLGPGGEVLGMTRITQARASLQPSIVPTGPTEAIALLRNMSRGICFMTTADAGREWSDPVRLDLVAPNSSIVGIRLPDGRLLLVYNNSAKRRQNLSLAVSSDGGRQWQTVHELEGEDGSFSYPCVLVASDGTVHATYTWNRLGIKHVWFNLAWLEAQK